jgi:PhnB protein
MQVNSYLMFDGQCEAAFKFYQRCLGGKIEAMIPFEGSPAESEVPPEWRQKILHASLTVGGQTLMGSDSPPGRHEKPQGFSVSVNVEQPADAERIFGALADQGAIQMPLEETFWAARFGMLVDRFGIPWMVNCAQAVAAAPQETPARARV